MHGYKAKIRPSVSHSIILSAPLADSMLDTLDTRDAFRIVLIFDVRKTTIPSSGRDARR